MDSWSNQKNSPWPKPLSWESKVAQWPVSFVSSAGYLTFFLHGTIRQSSGLSRSQLSGNRTHDDFEHLPLSGLTPTYSSRRNAMIHQISQKFKETKERILKKCTQWTSKRIQFLGRGTATSASRLGEILLEFIVGRKMCLRSMHPNTHNVMLIWNFAKHTRCHADMIWYFTLPPVLVNLNKVRMPNFRRLLAVCKRERK